LTRPAKLYALFLAPLDEMIGTQSEIFKIYKKEWHYVKEGSAPKSQYAN